MRKLRLVVMLSIVAVLVLAGCEFTYDSYTFDCEKFVVHITYGEATVDNTGNNQDRVAVRVVDGAGNIIHFDPDHYTAAVGDDWSDVNRTVEWTRAPQYNPLRVTFYNPAGGTLANDTVIHTFTGECPGLPYYSAGVPALEDGRINRHHIAAPVAFYPVDYGTGTGIHLYSIDAEGTGTLALTISPEQIAAVPGMPETNSMIASTPDGAIAVYRLTTGEFQINAGEYVVVFTDLHSLTDYYMP